MDSKIKDFIKDNKLSDEEIYKALQALKPAEDLVAETKVEASAEVKEPDQVEEDILTLPVVQAEKTSAESTQTDVNNKVFSISDLNKIIDARVAEELKKQPKDKPQTGMPVFENTNIEKQWKRL